MAIPGTPRSGPPERTPVSSDFVVSDSTWTTQVTDRIVSTVDTVRDRATVPAQTAARAVVWGIVAGIAGTVAAIALLIGLFRGLYVAVALIPWVDRAAGRSVWIVDLIVGGAFVFMGLRFLAKAGMPKRADDAG